MAEKTEPSIKWGNFKAQLKDVWTDLRDRDLEGKHDSLDELVDCIQTETGEAQDKVRQKVEFLVERFNVPLES